MTDESRNKEELAEDVEFAAEVTGVAGLADLAAAADAMDAAEEAAAVAAVAEAAGVEEVEGAGEDGDRGEDPEADNQNQRHLEFQPPYSPLQVALSERPKQRTDPFQTLRFFARSRRILSRPSAVL